MCTISPCGLSSARSRGTYMWVLYTRGGLFSTFTGDQVEEEWVLCRGRAVHIIIISFIVGRRRHAGEARRMDQVNMKSRSSSTKWQKHKQQQQQQQQRDEEEHTRIIWLAGVKCERIRGAIRCHWVDGATTPALSFARQQEWNLFTSDLFSKVYRIPL